MLSEQATRPPSLATMIFRYRNVLFFINLKILASSPLSNEKPISLSIIVAGSKFANNEMVQRVARVLPISAEKLSRTETILRSASVILRCEYWEDKARLINLTLPFNCLGNDFIPPR